MLKSNCQKSRLVKMGVRLMILSSIIIMCTAFAGCGADSSNKKALGKLSDVENEAIEAVESLMDAFETRDLEKIDAILYNPDIYKGNHESNLEWMERASVKQFRNANHKIEECKTDQLGFCNVYRIWMNGSFDFKNMDLTLVDGKYAEKVIEEMKLKDEQELSIERIYKSIHSAENCQFTQLKDESIRDVTLYDIIQIDASKVEAAYVIDAEFPYYWGDELYGIDKERLCEFSEYLNFFESGWDRAIELRAKRSKQNVIAYKAEGNWYVFMDVHDVYRYTMTWDGKEE